MRSLIGKVIEIKGESLKEISDNGSDSPVVVFTQTKDFSVTKQRRATFNIMNPRKVIFMGSAGGDDPTTRAERREQELEERRRRGPLGRIAGGAAGSSMFTGGGGGGVGGGGAGGGNFLKSIGNFIANNKALSTILGLGILSRIPIVGPLVRIAARLGFDVTRAGARFMFGPTQGPRAPGGVGPRTRGPSRATQMTNRARQVADAATRPRQARVPGTRPRNVGPAGGQQAADAAAERLARQSKLTKFLTSGTRVAKFARLALGGSTFGLSLLAEYLIFESAAQLDKLNEMMNENNRALNAMPGERKEQFQKLYSGATVHEYHKEMMELFGVHLPEMLRGENDTRAKQGLPLITEAEFLRDRVQPEHKYALPHKLSNLQFNAGSFAEMVDLHANAAAGPDAFKVIDHKLQQRINIEGRQKPIGRPLQQPSFQQSTVDFLGIGPKADVVSFDDNTFVPPSGRASATPLPTPSKEDLYKNQLRLHQQNPEEYPHPDTMPFFQKPIDQETIPIESPILIPVPAGANPNTFPNPNIPDFGGGMLTSRDPNAKDLRDIAIGNNHVPSDFVIA